ncbi:MAG: hypothetical protein K6B38_04625 [Ruminococcus sp.]|nr:hypothetical protein [Ruminococcus sp.]
MKSSYEKLINQIKKHWIMFWMVCSLIGVGTFIGFASYTGVNSAKRVASTRPAAKELFSSNVLKSQATSQRISSKEYTITVCNYDQKDSTAVNQNPITYEMIAYLVIKKGENNYIKVSDYLNDEAVSSADKEYYQGKLDGKTYSIQMVGDDADSSYTGTPINLVSESGYSTTITDNCTLAGVNKSTDQFKIRFDDQEHTVTEPIFYIYVEAHPISLAALTTIFNRLGTAQSTADAASWQGKLIETDCQSVDYDFYNYVLTGNGVGTVDIMWDPTKFEPNDFFFNELSGNEFVLYDSNGDETEGPGNITKTFTNADHTNWKMATLKVDSTDTNRYQIQLYKINEELSYTGDTNKASNFIDCKYHKSASAAS